MAIVAWPDRGAAARRTQHGRLQGDFYIICPDNDVTSEVDAKRIQWAANDIAENRPPLSRWHPDYGDAFAEFLKS